MYGIIAAMNNQISQVQNNQAKATAYAAISFIDTVRSLASSPVAVTERSYLEELALRKKQEITLSLVQEEDESDDLISLFTKMQERLEKLSLD